MWLRGRHHGNRAGSVLQSACKKEIFKRAQTEGSAILQYLQRIAISHPEIAFKLIADGSVKMQTIGNGKLKDAIYSVYGGEFSSSLVECDHTVGDFHIHGFITRPEMARSNHSWQSFYINSRFVKSKTMQFAMEDAYKSFVKSEKFPGCVLFLTIDAEKVDVNVHPAKLEVRFDDERSVYNAVYQAVRNTLSALSNRLARDEYEMAVAKAKSIPQTVIPDISEKKEQPKPSIEVQSGAWKEKSTELSLFSPAPSRGKSTLLPEEDRIKVEKVAVESATDLFFEPKDSTVNIKENPPLPVTPVEEETEEKPIQEEPEQMAIEGVLPEEKNDNPLSLLGTIRGVVFSAFILYETKDTLYLIDKHAAHERILYEALKKSHKKDSTQLFLEPVVLSLTPNEAAAIADHLKELEDAGFLLEEFGETSFLLRGIPMEFISLSGDAIRSLLEESAKELILGGKAGGAGEKKFDRTLYSMACKAAVKAGIPSTDADHKWIVEKLREIDNITVCPHGRPVLVPFTKKQIENLFLRT